MASEILQRNPTSTGNRQVHTWSSWVKLNRNSSISNTIYYCASSGSNEFKIQIANGQISTNDYSAGAYQYQYNTTRLLRDYGNWFHLMLAVDTTQTREDDRFKIYVNGVLYSGSYNTENTNGGQNYLTRANTPGNICTIGQNTAGGANYDANCQLTDVFMVDGQALTPDVFGFNKDDDGYVSVGSTQATDFRPGQWVPKSPRTIKSEINRRGGFGVNGFYLPMNDSSNFGADFHMTPNTIIKLKGEDLPQPRNGAPTTSDNYVSQLRSDPYASNLVLAIPGISGGQGSGYGDYSADIKGSGSNKTVAAYGNAGIADIPSYYGSAIRFDGTDDYMEVGSAGESDFNFGAGDFTVEAWMNFVSFGDSPGFGIWDGSNNQRQWLIYFNNSGYARYYTSTNGSGSVNVQYNVAQSTNEWVHVAMERNGSRLTGYINGVAVGFTLGLGSSSLFTTTNDKLELGRWSYTNTNDGNYFLQDLRIYKGVAKYKGGFDVPKPYRPVGIESWRQVSDTCKNNFCTMDPNHSYTVKRNTGAYVATILNFTEGNLNVRNSGNGGLSPQMAGFSSFGMDSGKWYWELSNWENPANERYGISLGREQVFTQTGNGAAIECMLQVRGSNGQISSGGNHNGTDYEYLVSGTIDNTNATAITSSSDVVGLAFDRDNMAFYVYTNGTLTASITNITTSKTKVSTWFATKGNNSSSTSSGQTYNFGQNPTFGGTITAGTYTDSNGKGLFKYQPPAGYLALCEDNLPAPAIADPGEHFKTVLWTGAGTSGRSITGVGFEPDLVWLKKRNDTTSHNLTDSVRGIGYTLFSDDTSADNTNTARLQSFDNDGFTVGNHTAVNNSGDTFVAWCWKAGGAAVANTDGSINSQVSANQTAGFSIVSYTGTGSVGTVGHGLGKRPKVVIVKRRDASTNWPIFFDGISNNTNDLLQLNLTNATATAGNFFNGGDTTTTTFPLGTGDGQTNESGSGHIAYCWAEIPGYSKFSFYQGTGQADGPFVYCGFKPAWVMIKSSSNSGTNWRIWDSSRGSINPTNLDLLANTTHIENAHGSDEIDLLSNGFKIRSTGSWHNSSGGTYVFMAFAESPFQTANAK